jgi:hypothetical protein
MNATPLPGLHAHRITPRALGAEPVLNFSKNNPMQSDRKPVDIAAGPDSSCESGFGFKIANQSISVRAGLGDVEAKKEFFPNASPKKDI